MKSLEVFLGRQPILDRKGDVFAYELLFRAGRVDHCDITDDLHATASVISHTFGRLGAENVLGTHLGFINVNAEMLYSDLLIQLPPEQVVLELLETVVITPELIDRCRQLKTQGFMLALDDFIYTDDFIALLPMVDFVKIDLQAHQQDELPAIVTHLRQWPARLLAEKVDNPDQAEYCRSLGFDLFQGYYFARPAIISSRRQDASSRLQMNLLRHILEPQADLNVFDLIKQDATLTYSLLRLANSATGLNHPIDTLSTAARELGQRQLHRWLQLLLYSKSRSTHFPTPLAELAAMRGRMMELLVHHLWPNSPLSEHAFATGALSLLEAAFDAPMTEVLKDMPPEHEVVRALLCGEGALGRLLRLVRKTEINDKVSTIREVAEHEGLTMKILVDMELDAIRWVVGLAERRT